MTTVLHPDALFQALFQKPRSRSERREALTRLQEICSSHFESGARDFSLPVIGRLVEGAGIMKGRALYNAQSADYKALIESWALFSGAQPAPESSKNTSQNSSVSTPKPRHRIARNYVEPISNTRNVSKNDEIVSNLELQIALLKAEKEILESKLSKEVGLRNQPVARPRGRTPLSKWSLNNEDVEAFKKALSPEFLRLQGWKLNSRLQVVNERGEVVFETGFVQGIRKVLATEISTSKDDSSKEK